MHGSRNDVPVTYEGDGAILREIEWGDMNVGIETMPAGLDTAPLFVGLPDDRCQCPHWGYLVKGRFRAQYKDHEEAFSAGDAYYLTPGHTIVFEEDSETVEFSPKGKYQETIEVAEGNIARMQSAAGA